MQSLAARIQGGLDQVVSTADRIRGERRFDLLEIEKVAPAGSVALDESAVDESASTRDVIDGRPQSAELVFELAAQLGG